MEKSYIKSKDNSYNKQEYGKYVKEAFGLNDIKVFYDSNVSIDKKVTKVAILPGSGKSGIEEAIKQGADVFITGDIGHHEGMDASDRGLTIFDAGHYGVEHIFVEDMGKYLKQKFGNEVEVKCASIKHPFTMI